MAAISEDDVLGLLDEAADDFLIPGFDNIKVDYIGFRLEVYRGEEDWALVFNSITYGDGQLTTVIDPAGSCVEIPGRPQVPDALFNPMANKDIQDAFAAVGKGGNFMSSLKAAMGAVAKMQQELPKMKAEHQRAMAEAAEAGAFADPQFIDTGELDIDYRSDDTEAVRGITVRGTPVPLASLTYSEPPDPNNLAFLTAVAIVENPKLREVLFATREELQPFFTHGMPPRILTLNEWNHFRDERPSETDTFQMLAQVIARNDVKLYRPRSRPNTRWDHWFPK
jgi:hypothetical protein